MTLASIYVLFCVVGLPFWVAQQHVGGRQIPFVLASCCYVALSVFLGTGIPIDNTTIAAGCIGAWLCTSLIWTDTHKSVFELLNLVSYLVLFTASREVPLALIAIGFFMVGTAFAAFQAYQTFHRTGIYRISPHANDRVLRNNYLQYTYFIFGNGNHTGTFMLMNLFVGLWLVTNLTPWLLIFLPLTVFALIATRCKGAIVATVTGLIASLFFAGMWVTGLCSLFAAIVAGVMYWARADAFIDKSIGSRVGLWKAAIELIMKRPLTGCGLNGYAKHLPETTSVITSTAGPEAKRSHRVHNDHLEIIVELGALGYVLYGYLFTTLSYTPVLFGLMVAFVTHAIFFFPFREVHTAVPFWAIMGAMTMGTAQAVNIPVPVKGVIIAMAAAAAIKTLRMWMGYRYSERAKSASTEEEKRVLYDMALTHDPLDGGYLCDAAYVYFVANPLKAFWLMAQAATHYDGTRMKHDVLDMFARTIINAKEAKICHWLEDRAILLERDDKSAQEVKNFLIMREGRATK